MAALVINTAASGSRRHDHVLLLLPLRSGHSLRPGRRSPFATDRIPGRSASKVVQLALSAVELRGHAYKLGPSPRRVAFEVQRALAESQSPLSTRWR